MEVNSDSLSRAFMDFSGQPSYLALRFGCATCIAFHGSDTFDAHPLRVVDEVFECLRAWVAESLMLYVC